MVPREFDILEIALSSLNHWNQGGGFFIGLKTALVTGATLAVILFRAQTVLKTGIELPCKQKIGFHYGL